MIKSSLLMSIFALFMMASCLGQSADEKAIEKTIMGFSKSGDQNDADKLATYLDDNYRIVMNRLFGSAEVSTMSKDLYLEKIRNKEFGGDSRKVKIENLLLNGSTASAKVSFAGSQMSTINLLTLVQASDGTWKLVSDMPVIK